MPGKESGAKQNSDGLRQRQVPQSEGLELITLEEMALLTSLGLRRAIADPGRATPADINPHEEIARMGEILDTVADFLEEDGWPIAPIEDQPIIRSGFQGDNGQWTCYAQAREDQAQCVIYSVCPVNVPEDRRLAVAELLTRANYGLIVGNFEMDFSDGEIRYKTSIDVQDDHLSSTLVRNLVYTNVITMDRYWPAIMSVIYGDVSPAEAIVEIEG